MSSIADQIKFDDNGLVVSVVQDADNGDVLMVAWLNRDALEKTLETGVIHYYSRSRKKFWVKGEESGNGQELVGMFIDCDADTILFKVRQAGGACHNGYRHCFYRQVDLGKDAFRVVAEKVFDPQTVYKKPH